MTIHYLNQTIRCPDCHSDNLLSTIRAVETLELDLVYNDETHDFEIRGDYTGYPEQYDDHIHHECLDCYHILSTDDLIPNNLPTP